MGINIYLLFCCMLIEDLYVISTFHFQNVFPISNEIPTTRKISQLSEVIDISACEEMNDQNV